MTLLVVFSPSFSEAPSLSRSLLSFSLSLSRSLRAPVHAVTHNQKQTDQYVSGCFVTRAFLHQVASRRNVKCQPDPHGFKHAQLELDVCSSPDLFGKVLEGAS